MSETTLQKELDLLTELITGPLISEVATKVLRPALDALYPQLKIDPTLATVVSPAWTITRDRVIPGKNSYESLTNVLVRLGYTGKYVNYIDGEHFLTLHPGVEPMVQLAVKIDAIGALLNALAPLLFNAYQQQQLDYWNQEASPATPRWHRLSQSLQDVWNLDATLDWNEDEKAIARAVFNQPDRATRRASDKYKTRACLIDVDGLKTQGDPGSHSWILDAAVLVGTLGERTFVLTHSIVEGFRRYDTIEALGERLPARHNMRWRLYEPDGNFFHHQACALIALEIDAIGDLSSPDNSTPPRLSTAGHSHPRNFSDASPQPASHFSKVEALTPDWLKNASPADLTRYSRHLMDIASLREKDAGKTFLDGVPALRDFTLQRLREQMINEHPDASALKLEDVEMSITSVVVIGTFVVPSKPQVLRLSLVELALQNLVGLPLGNKAVYFKNGKATPAWMTPAYLEQLVRQVNIGDTYPALIKQKLLSDPPEQSRRQDLYTRHLRIQLPLQALQCKIREQAGIDERGYQYVLAALQEKPADRYVDGQEIIIRPLAFVHDAQGTADTVANMFVIGPRLSSKGPCLLYRPLLEHPLLQYPGEANLLYAIKHSKTLRQSVLAWLPDAVRFNYSQYAFPGELPAVWTIGQLLVEPSSLLGKMANVTFSSQALAGEPVAALFKANAEAIVTLADRQSVSNAEARWATLKQGAWMMFSVALPFLGRTLSTAAWVWQIMDDLQQASDAREAEDSDTAWSAMTDLLLTLSMVLAHQAAARQRSAAPAVEKIAAERPAPHALPAPKPSVTRLPDWQSSQPPAAHESSLHTPGALTPKGLGKVLDALSIDEPAGLKPAAPAPGPYQHLRGLDHRWYAQVGQRWFEVTLNDNEDVQIIDSRQTPAIKGPLLVHSAKGQWFVDMRLRLRGGGRRLELMRKNQQRKSDLRQKLEAFDARKHQLESELQTAENAFTQANLQSLGDTLDAQVAEYGAYIELLKEYNALEPLQNYRPVLVSCLDNQLSLTQKWFALQHPSFTEALRQSLTLLDQKAPEGTLTPRQTYQFTSDMTQHYIHRIEFANARIAEMTRLGKDASEIAREYSLHMPAFKLADLKMFQVSIAQELCINDSAPGDLAAARQAMEKMVEDVCLTIQSSLDLTASGEAVPLLERIDGFNDLVEQFANLDQRIADLAPEFPEELLGDSLEIMRERVKAFNEPTTRQLTSLLLERRLLAPTPGPSRSAPPRSRIIKTRFKGTVVGTPRPRKAGEEANLYDVTSPLTGKVIATFHEKSPGNWLEHVPAKAPSTARPTLDLSIQKGQILLDQMPAFSRRTESHANQAGRIPVEIEEMFNQQARRMKQAAEAIEKALTDLNATDGGQTSAVDLVRQLNEGAAGLYEQGRQARISMIKKQPPTAARVQWLHEKGLVEIVRVPGRSRLKGQRKDFLEEYEIRERAAGDSKGVLWYAHFHYPKADTPADGYTAAHLKTASQRKLGSAFEMKTAPSSSELIAIYRSEISPQLAKALFLPGGKPN